MHVIRDLGPVHLGFLIPMLLLSMFALGLVLWRLALNLGMGERAPEKIQRFETPFNAELRALYPYLDDYSIAYLLKFPEPFPAVDARLLRDAPGVVSHYVDGVVHTPTRVPIGEPVRYVRVQAADGNFLEMTELQVWGRDAAR